MPPEPLGNSLAILPAVATAIATASPSGSSEIISVVRWCGCCGCCGCGCNCHGCRRCSSACIRHFALVNVGAVSVSSCISKTCTACRCGAASWALVARLSQGTFVSLIGQNARTPGRIRGGTVSEIVVACAVAPDSDCHAGASFLSTAGDLQARVSMYFDS